VRPKLMRGAILSLDMLGGLIPILLPLPVSAVQPQGEHAFSVLRRPPSARPFESLLHDIAMRTLDFARADGQTARQGALVVELVAAMIEAAPAGVNRRLRGSHRAQHKVPAPPGRSRQPRSGWAAVACRSRYQQQDGGAVALLLSNAAMWICRVKKPTGHTSSDYTQNH
jgi:hypothetical protein